ncbi:MAG: MarR family transcriptional regulator, partial [Myxococcota bacterium]
MMNKTQQAGNTTAAATDNPKARLLGEQIIQVLNLVLRTSAGDTLSIMAESGLTMPQIVTLHILRSAGPFTVSAIAERLKLSKAATSHLIEQLVVKGFVTRIEDSVDRRRKSVSITPKGNRIVERLMQLRRNTFQTAINQLTP